MTTYLARLGPRLTQDKVHKWLARANKPILLNLRKGNLSFAEQQACLLHPHRFAACTSPSPISPCHVILCLCCIVPAAACVLQ